MGMISRCLTMSLWGGSPGRNVDEGAFGEDEDEMF